MMKLTNVLALEMVLGFEEVKANAELVEKLEKMKAQFEKKNNSTGERKPTKTQLENLGLIEKIKVVLSDGEPKTITDIQNCDTELQEFTNQKMSSLLKKLVDSQEVTKYTEKRKTYFKMEK